MPVVALNAAKLRSLKPPPSGQIEYWDQLTPGLSLRMSSSGRASWSLRYRPQSGDGQKRINLGTYPHLSLAEARQRSNKLRVEVSGGGDPQAERHKNRAAASLNDLIEKYLNEHVKPKKKPRTHELYCYYFYKLIGPVLGHRKASAVTYSEIAKLHRAIGTDRPVSANRAIVALSGVYTFAAKHDLVPHGFNPTRDIEKFPEAIHERYLSKEELGRLGEALRVAETEGLPWPLKENRGRSRHDRRPENWRTVLTPYVTAAFRLLLFTGCRLREILNLRWAEVDLERGLLLLPDSKTGRKAIVLNAAASEVIGALPRRGKFVIAGDADDRARSDLKRPWKLISRYARLEDVRIHDLRHTHASVGAAVGLGLLMIGKLLGHRDSETTARYAHLGEDPLRKASNRIGASLSVALGKLEDDRRPRNHIRLAS